MLDPAAHYRANGWRRYQTFPGGPGREAREFGRTPVIIDYRQHGWPSAHITFAEPAQLTGRFAGVPRELGASRGGTVAGQLLATIELPARFGEA